MPALVTYVRYSTGETDLKAVLSKKIPKEQERVKNFRKQHGATKVGEVTVDMVSFIQQQQKILIELIKIVNKRHIHAQLN